MKDWNNIPDEEFDDAFKEIFLNHDQEVWPNAWPLMEEKLEEENRKRRFVIFWRSAAAILIFGTLGIFSTRYFKGNGSGNKTSKIEKNFPKDIRKDNNITVEEISTAENNNEKQITDASDFSKTPQTSPSKSEINSSLGAKSNILDKVALTTKKKNDSDSNTNSKSNEKVNIAANTKSENEQTSNQLEKQNTKIQNTEIEQTNVKTHLSLSEKENKTTELTELKDASITKSNTKTEEAYFKEDTVIILTGRTPPNTGQSNSNDISAALPSENSNFFQKFALNLGFSPDYSKVVASEFGSMGYNLQVILDYRFNNKWALRAGVIKSKKLYDAYPEDYTWPVNWGKPSSPLKEVTAACDMLDIPVSLSYQVLQKGPNKLYTSLGITNYKMMKEKYEYWYENDADPNLKMRNWEGSSGFFGAGVVNVSVGLERRITNFLSVQVEPFVKIPVKNVGLGNVKLFTTGIFLNLKTQAPRKKIQPK